MSKKLLILGGGENQVPIIKKAKQLGYYVILCDYLLDNPGKQYADIHYAVSTYDYEAVLTVARKEKIDGIVTNSEPVLHIMATITDELNLPSVTSQTISLFMDKNLMRNHLTKYGYNTVRYRCCENMEQAIDFFSELKCMLVMKPVDSSSSRGVYTIKNEDDIRKHFEQCQNSNRRKNLIILENYIEGQEFSVDGISISGKHFSLGVSKKRQFTYNENLDRELYFSYSDENYDYDELRQYNNQIAESTGIIFGMTHAEYKFYDGQFHFIEMAARGGGMFISTLIIPYISGIDTLRILIESSLGEQKEEAVELKKEFQNRCAILKFFSSQNDQVGTVRYISGLHALEQKGILKYSINCKVGDYVKQADDGTNRLGYYIAVAETRQELANIISSVDENVVIGL